MKSPSDFHHNFVLFLPYKNHVKNVFLLSHIWYNMITLFFVLAKKNFHISATAKIKKERKTLFFPFQERLKNLFSGHH